MASTSTNLGQQLTARETVNTTARVNYERQLQEILEERLRMPVRLCCHVIGIVCILFGGAVGFVVFSDWESHQYWPNLMLGFVVTASAIAIGTALVGVAARGVYRRQHEGRWAAASGLTMLATWGLFMLLSAFGLPDSLRGIFLTLGLICLGVAAFVAHRLSASRTQLVLEKRLLEIERRIAEISERLG